jgi:glutamine amidotransferase
MSAGGRTVAIVDYGVVNLGSIRNMLAKLGFAVDLVSTPDGVERAERLILPGIGAFDAGMTALETLGLVEALRARAAAGNGPFMGICLGMQLLSEKSEEGTRPGLGIIRGRCVRLRVPAEDRRLKVPHMGWNVVHSRREHALLAGLDPHARFYFTHSFHLMCDDPAEVLATVRHGIEFTAMIQRGAILGMQCHPEKSHRFGMTVLRNFGNLPC